MPALRGEPVRMDDGTEVVPFPDTTPRALLVKEFMSRSHNYSQSGIQLRQVINLFDEVDFSTYDYVVLPGGLPGATNLRADQRVCDLVTSFGKTKHVAAICAAPFILGELGVLEGHRATCFPGFEKSFPEGCYAGGKTVVVSGNVITASGMGQALPFALAVLEDIAGNTAVEKVKAGIQL